MALSVVVALIAALVKVNDSVKETKTQVALQFEVDEPFWPLHVEFFGNV